jgi:hypothetical protein
MSRVIEVRIHVRDGKEVDPEALASAFEVDKVTVDGREVRKELSGYSDAVYWPIIMTDDQGLSLEKTSW